MGRLSDRCPQCGRTYGARACGPTHAAIAVILQDKERAADE